ncbi:MAG: Maf family protein [Clostridia bacterium]
MTLILASKSPRRNELLLKITKDFKVIPTNVEEIKKFNNPRKCVKDLSYQKIVPLMAQFSGDILLGVDTLVYYKGQFLGKPKDDQEAKRFLRLLSGKWHAVYSGVTLAKGQKITQFCAKSLVCFNKLTNLQIENYIKTGSCYDKAGGYGIQDGDLVKKYKGSYNNIVGLPTEKLKKYLRRYND